jgi:hypothetical protein
MQTQSPAATYPSPNATATIDAESQPGFTRAMIASLVVVLAIAGVILLVLGVRRK